MRARTPTLSVNHGNQAWADPGFHLPVFHLFRPISPPIGLCCLALLAQLVSGCASTTPEAQISASLSDSIRGRKLSLAGISREAMPLKWAQHANNLGADLSRLGALERNTAVLQEAADLFGEAIVEYSASPNPLAAANTQRNLCATMLEVAKIKKSLEHFRAAEEPCRAAAAIPIKHPAQQAHAYRLFGNVLWEIGRMKNNPDYVEQARPAYEASLELWGKGGDQFEKARTYNDLGTALGFIGSRRKERETLIRAVEAFKLALEGWPRERFPKSRSNALHNLGTTLLYLGEQEASISYLLEAETAYREALEERGPDVPENRIHTLKSLAEVLSRLSKTNHSAKLSYAAEASRLLHEARQIDQAANHSAHPWASVLGSTPP